MLREAELQIRCVTLTSIDSTCVIFSPNPMFDHKGSNIGFGEEIGIIKTKIRTLSAALLLTLK